MTRKKITAFFLSLGLLLSGLVVSATTEITNHERSTNAIAMQKITAEELFYHYFILQNLKVHKEKCWFPAIPGKLPPGKGPVGCWPPYT